VPERTRMLPRPASRRHRAVAAGAAALMLSACTSAPAAAPSGSGSVTGDLAAQVTAFLALAPEEQEAQLRTLSADVERQLVTLSGLEKELGGPTKATAAYTAMTSDMVARATKFRATSGYVGKFGGMARSADAPSAASLGGMIFVGWMLGALSAGTSVSASNDAKPGAEPQRDVKTDDSGVNKSTLVREASLESTSVDWAMETTEKGVTGKVRVKNTINPCPNPAGEFTGTISMTASSTTAGGRVGSNTSIEIAITGHVDDDAKLVGYDVTSQNQAAEFGNGNNKWAEVTDKVSWAGDKVASASRTVGRTAGNPPPEFGQQWANLGRMTEMMLTSKVLEAAQKGWESGRCVTLVPTASPDKRKGLTPSATVTITAPPRSRIDGSKVGGTVTATLTGDTSVDPAATKVPADATFTYTAPGEKYKSGTVALEARSRRGVAKAELVFDTRQNAYKVTGFLASAPSGTTFTGSICSPDKPFTVATSGDMVGTVSYRPKSDTAGSLTFKGKVGNAPLSMSGSGTYTLEEPKDSGTGTLSMTWKVSIHIPVVGDQTKSGTVGLTLTPSDTC
jgi:hypothetical protein